MDEQQTEMAHYHEKATLEIEAVVRLHNQLVFEIKILRILQSTRNQKIEGSHTPPSLPPSTTRAAPEPRAIGGARDHSPRVGISYFKNFGSQKSLKTSLVEDIE